MAASRGRRHLLEWLARHSTEALLNAKDGESGYTPLHRSIFYGQIHVAVALMKMGNIMVFKYLIFSNRLQCIFSFSLWIRYIFQLFSIF